MADVVDTWSYGDQNTKDWLHDGDVERSAADIIDTAENVAALGEQITAAAAQAVQDVNAAGSEQMAAIEGVTASQVAIVEAAGTAQAAAVAAEGASQIVAIDGKASDVIDSIQETVQEQAMSLLEAAIEAQETAIANAGAAQVAAIDAEGAALVADAEAARDDAVNAKDAALASQAAAATAAGNAAESEAAAIAAADSASANASAASASAANAGTAAAQAAASAAEAMSVTDFDKYQHVNTKPWASAVDYDAGALALGSDGNLYVALQANGPATAAVNPVGDTSGKWERIASQSDITALEEDIQDASDAASNALASHALVSHIQDTYMNPILWHFGGVDCGGDLPRLDGFDEDQWNGATQSVFVDRFSGVYYLSQQNSSNATRLVAMKWSEDPAQRVSLGQTNYSYNIIGHQNNSLYRPTQGDEPLFFFPANYYNSATTGDVSKKYFVRVAKWDYTTSTPTVLYSLKVFDSGTYTTDDLLAACVSADSKKLVAEATRKSDNIRVCRVWDAAEVLAYAATATPDASGLIDISSLVKREFEESTSYTQQGIYCDGNYVYHLSGSYKPEIRAFHIGGAVSIANTLATYLSVAAWDSEAQWTYIQYEPEGIFWAEYGGKVQAFLHVSAALHYDDNGTDQWKRRDRFFCLSIPQRTLIFSKDLVLCFGNGPVPPTITTSTYEHTRFYHVRQQNQDPALNTYSFIATNRSNGTIGSSYMSGGTYIGWSEKKKSVAYYQLTYQYLLNEETGELTFGNNTRLSFFKTNTANLGSASELWKEVFAGNAVINTSDERKKDNISAFPDAVLDAWGEVGWCQYQMKDALAEKGEAARLHSGVIAQRIASIFEAHGLDASRYGMFCYDKWDDEYEEQEDGTRVLVTPAGDAYGIRYAEALAIEAAYQRRRADMAEARIDALERRLNEMESVLASMIAPVGDETYAGSEEGGE